MRIDASLRPGERIDGGVTASHVHEITAVICTHNRYDVLPDAIESLTAQSLPADTIEIIVVDNSSDTATQKDYWSLHELPENAALLVERTPGLSRARNLALKESRAPVIAYLDDDAIAMTDWCASIVDAFRSFEDAGIVGGPVEPIWPGTAPSWLHKWQRGFLTIVDYGNDFRPLNDGEWLAGTNIAFRTSALREAGGFNEALGRTGTTLLSNEELAITRRIMNSGLQAYYLPQARVMHRIHAERATQRWLRQRVCWQAVSDLLSAAQRPTKERCWADLASYLGGLPVEMRGMRGFFLDTPDPETFYAQCRALEALMHLALNEAEDPERE
ncbi:MAG TPA: glycosyltransferase [Rhizomicrobium sp.]|jgi:glycosyltransferase involved in cell wall biosynthesis|nr:glycosyltransferase [Rhizomicrobium sp.]